MPSADDPRTLAEPMPRNLRELLRHDEVRAAVREAVDVSYHDPSLLRDKVLGVIDQFVPPSPVGGDLDPRAEFARVVAWLEGHGAMVTPGLEDAYVEDFHAAALDAAVPIADPHHPWAGHLRNRIYADLDAFRSARVQDTPAREDGRDALGRRVWIGWERDDGHWATAEELREAARASLIGAATGLVNGLLVREGVSRSQLAKRIGKTPAFVTQVLDGERNMTLRTLADLCSGLGYAPSLAASSLPVQDGEERAREEWQVVSDVIGGPVLASDLPGERTAHVIARSFESEYGPAIAQRRTVTEWVDVPAQREEG